MFDPQQSDIEIAINSHAARPGWRVLRVTYATPRHEDRIIAALDAIFGLLPPSDRLQGGAK